MSTDETKIEYHTTEELYEHRYLLFLLYMNQCPTRWKSKCHAEGDVPMFEDSFIAGAESYFGRIVYHLPLRFWDACKGFELSEAPPWDGHTSFDTLNRMRRLLGIAPESPEPSAKFRARPSTDNQSGEALVVKDQNSDSKSGNGGEGGIHLSDSK